MKRGQLIEYPDEIESPDEKEQWLHERLRFM